MLSSVHSCEASKHERLTVDEEFVGEGTGTHFGVDLVDVGVSASQASSSPSSQWSRAWTHCSSCAPSRSPRPIVDVDIFVETVTTFVANCSLSYLAMFVDAERVIVVREPVVDVREKSIDSRSCSVSSAWSPRPPRSTHAVAES